MTLTLSGCASLQKRLDKAAAAEAKAKADDALPALPAECYVDEPHAVLAAGMEARSAIARERQATNRANGSKRRCVNVYTNLQTERAKR